MKHKDLDARIINSANFYCYVADKDTYDIIYVNKPMQKVLEPFVGEGFDFIGHKCYKIFQNLDAPCPHCENPNLSADTHIFRQMFVELTQRNYIIIDSLIEIDGKLQRLTIAHDNSCEHPTTKTTQDELYFLQHANEFLALLDATPLCMNLLNTSKQTRICNQKVLDTFNLPDRKAYSENFYKLSPKFQPDGRTSEEAAMDYIKQASENGHIKFKWLHCDLDGNEIPTELELKKLDLLDEENQPYLACYFKDLRSELAGTEEDDWSDGYFHDTISSKTLFKSIADMVEGWYFALDLRTSNIQFFGKGKEILHLPSEKVLYPDSFDIKNIVHEDDIAYFYEVYNDIIKGRTRTWEVRYCLPSGEYKYFRTIYKIIHDDKMKPIYCVGRTFDVHDEKMLEVLSQTDHLTNCYNKATSESLIRSLLHKNLKSSHALFIFDIDNFKSINDTLGHQAGDIVLEQLVKNLQLHFRDNDIIGRMGGDEFVIFLKNISDIDAIAAKAEKIALAFKKVKINNKIKQSVTGSVGIALYPSDGKDYEELYSSADKALYQAKIKGKNCYTFFADNNFKNQKISHTLENADRVVNTYIDSDFVNNVFDIMYKAKDLNSSMHEVLQYISEKFSVQRVYTYEIQADKETYKLTYEYHQEDYSPSDHALNEISKTSFLELFSELTRMGMLLINDIDVIENKMLYDSLQIQKVKNVLLLQVKGETLPEIVLGLDDCVSYREWDEKQINSLRYLVKLLSIFLVFARKNIQ